MSLSDYERREFARIEEQLRADNLRPPTPDSMVKPAKPPRLRRLLMVFSTALALCFIAALVLFAILLHSLPIVLMVAIFALLLSHYRRARQDQPQGRHFPHPWRQ